MVIIKNTEAKCIIEIKICTKKLNCEQEKIGEQACINHKQVQRSAKKTGKSDLSFLFLSEFLLLTTKTDQNKQIRISNLEEAV